MKQKVKAVCARTMILAALCLALTTLCGCDSDSSSGGGSHALDGTTWKNAGVTIEFDDGEMDFTGNAYPYTYSFDGQFDEDDIDSASGTGKYLMQGIVVGQFTINGNKLTWAGLTYTFYT